MKIFWILYLQTLDIRTGSFVTETQVDSRKYSERRYYDRVFGNDIRAKTRKYYVIARTNEVFYRNFLAERCAGKDVLEYGCGLGNTAFFLASNKARVVGIDISEVAIQQAAEEAERRRTVSVSFQVMDAEATTYSDNQFDIICGTGILHHLNLKAACTEMTRLLKPEGFGIFVEPLGHNPVIKLYRKLTPHLRTADEHPFQMTDLGLVSHYFDKVEMRYFHICTLLAVPFYRLGVFFTILLQTLQLFDRLLFAVPYFRKYAWMIAIIVSKPRPR
jgi:SAM-dependent methyltransferase